jgi:hypothetical protein
MADVQDVLDALVTQVASFVYPNGTGMPSVTGNPINIFPGWPMPGQIDQDMPLGVADVSVYAPPGMDRNTTRYRPKQKVMSIAAPTLTLAAAKNVVTVGGAMPAPFTAHNLALLVSGVAFIYPVQASDSLTSIATALATLLAASYPGTSSSGPVITLPSGTAPVVARVGTSGQITTEWEREQQMFQVTVWAPDFQVRKVIGAAIRSGFSPIHDLTMIDGYGANIRYQSNRLSDDPEKVGIYRRDLSYLVEYATTLTEQIATVVAVKVEYETQDGTPIVTRTY